MDCPHPGDFGRFHGAGGMRAAAYGVKKPTKFHEGSGRAPKTVANIEDTPYVVFLDTSRHCMLWS